MLKLFIIKTREIMDEEGEEGVSIRKIAQRSGYNSATLYTYFKDVDEVITVASLTYLENYCRALADVMKRDRSAYDTYLLTWEMFAWCAFAYPQIFNRLFFYPHATPLKETIARYYELFPDQLENIGGAVQQMLLGGTLEERDAHLLRHMADEGVIRHEDVELISALDAGYFRKLLDEKCLHGDAVDSDMLIRKLLEAVRFLLGR